MSALLLSPHNDDSELFAFYQVLRHKPKVVVVLRSFREASQGGPDFFVREWETSCAMRIAGVEWEQWTYSDLAPDWSLIAKEIEMAVSVADLVIAPVFEPDGHEQHNVVAEMADRFTNGRLIRYLTYERGQGRSKWGIPIAATPAERDLKQKALACYQSQIDYPPTAPWFPGGEYADLGEWLA